MFILSKQIFEWGHFVKLSGKMKNFPLKFHANLVIMYFDQAPWKFTWNNTALQDEFQYLWIIYKMEKDLARKKGKLKKFTKFTNWNWKSEGRQLSSDLHFSIPEGLQLTACAYQHYEW